MWLARFGVTNGGDHTRQLERGWPRLPVAARGSRGHGRARHARVPQGRMHGEASVDACRLEIPHRPVLHVGGLDVAEWGEAVVVAHVLGHRVHDVELRAREQSPERLPPDVRIDARCHEGAVVGISGERIHRRQRATVGRGCRAALAGERAGGNHGQKENAQCGGHGLASLSWC